MNILTRSELMNKAAVRAWEISDLRCDRANQREKSINASFLRLLVIYRDEIELQCFVVANIGVAPISTTHYVSNVV